MLSHIVLRRASVTAALAAALTLAVAPSAFASPEPLDDAHPSIAENLESIARYLARGGHTLTVPPQDDVARRLWLEEHEPLPALVHPPRRNEELARLRERTGLRVSPHQLRSAAGRIVLRASAFTFGWLVGTTARNMLERETMPAVPSPTGEQWAGESYELHAVRKDEVVASIGGRYVVAPSDGYEIRIKRYPVNTSVWSSQKGQPACSPPEPVIIAPTLPAGGIWLRSPASTFSNACTSREIDPVTGWWKTYSYTTDMEAAFLPANALAPEDFTGQPYDLHHNANTPDVPLDEVVSRLRSELENRPDDYPEVIRWLDVRLPSCGGLTYESCVVRLEAAGFTNVRRSDLGHDAADLDKPPNAVIDTSPASGSKTSPTDEIVVVTNPSEMPLLVPAPREDEDVDVYLGRLRDAGVSNADIVLQERWPWSTGDPAGAVIAAQPVGRQPRSVRVTVEHQRKNSCDRSPKVEPYAPGDDVADKWDPFRGGIVHDPTWAVDPTFPTPASAIEGEATLYWGSAWIAADPQNGWQGFGYRKIAAQHGFSREDEISTRVVLSTAAPTPHPTGINRERFIGDRYAGLDGRPCERVVIIEWAPKPGDPAAEHLITSYGRPVVAG